MIYPDDGLPAVELCRRLVEACETIEERSRRGEAIDLEAMVARFPTASRNSVRSELQALLAEVQSSEVEEKRVHSDLQYGATNEYQLLGPLAQGGMGRVLVAWDQDFSRRVALKEIQPDSADDTRYQQRFLQESMITARLEHPGVLPVYSRGRNAEDRPFYTMRLVEGGNTRTLQQAIEQLHDQTPCPKEREDLQRQLLRRLIDVCNTVAYAHSRGIAHRDLKPANILIGPFGETVVVDWGLAKIFQQPDGSSDEADREKDVADSEAIGSPLCDVFSSSLPSHGVGTRGYVAPEVLRLEPIGDWPRLDVFALGVILYGILTGRVPRSEIEPQVGRGSMPARRHSNDDTGDTERVKTLRDIDRSVPKSLEAICLKAMSRSPDQRYATPIDVANDLERYLANQPVSVLAESGLDRLLRWMNNNKKLTFASLMLGAMLALATGVIAFQQTKYSATLAQKSQQLSTMLASETKLRREQELASQRAEFHESVARKRESLAMRALQSYTDAISSNETLRNTETLAPVRRELLEKPLQYFEQIQQEETLGTEPSWEYLEQLARTSEDLAKLSFEYGDPVQCARWVDRSIERFQQLVEMAKRDMQEDRDDDVLKERLALSQVSLAGSYRLRATLQMPVDKSKAEESLRLAENLLEGVEDSVEWKERLLEARSLVDSISAVLAAEMRDVERMAKRFERAVADREELLAIARADEASMSADGLRKIDLRESELELLLHDRAHVGLVLKDGDIERHLEQLKRFTQWMQRRIAKGDNSERNRLSLAWALRNLGVNQREFGRLEDSEISLQQAVLLRRELIELFPSTTRYRADLAGTLGDLAMTLKSKGLIPQSIQSTRDSIDALSSLIGEDSGLLVYGADLMVRLHDYGHMLADDFEDAESQEAFQQSYELCRKLREMNPGRGELQQLWPELLLHRCGASMLRADWKEASGNFALYWSARLSSSAVSSMSDRDLRKALDLWEYCCQRCGDIEAIERVKSLRHESSGWSDSPDLAMGPTDDLLGAVLQHAQQAAKRLPLADAALQQGDAEKAIEIEREALQEMQHAVASLNQIDRPNDSDMEGLRKWRSNGIQVWEATIRNPFFVTVRRSEELDRWPEEDRQAWLAIWAQLDAIPAAIQAN
jgi:serine/threonine protein kinase